jgi:hypothetical protein
VGAWLDAAKWRRRRRGGSHVTTTKVEGGGDGDRTLVQRRRTLSGDVAREQGIAPEGRGGVRMGKKHDCYWPVALGWLK